LLAQLLLRDDAVGMRQQVGQHLERFAAQPADTPGAAQLIALGVEAPLTEDVPHGKPPPPWASGLPPHGAWAERTRPGGGRARVRSLPAAYLARQRGLPGARRPVYH